MDRQTFPKNPRKRGKSHLHHLRRTAMSNLAGAVDLWEKLWGRPVPVDLRDKLWGRPVPVDLWEKL